jgi:uncharacterized protein
MTKTNLDHARHEAFSLAEADTSYAPCMPAQRGMGDGSLGLTDPVGEDHLNDLWLRGRLVSGGQDFSSAEWFGAFMARDVAQDVLSRGPRIHVTNFRRLWTTMAYSQGAGLNVAGLAKDLGLSVRTISRYLDIFAGLGLLRLLQPWGEDVGKRLVRTPKLYLRDSGLVHGLLGIATMDDLLRHSVVNRSWEGFCLETLIAAAPPCTAPFFYRTSAGTQLDLVLRFADRAVWAFEITRAGVPRPSRGLHTGAQDIKASRKILVHAGEQGCVARDDLQVMSLDRAIHVLRQHAVNGAQGRDC